MALTIFDVLSNGERLIVYSREDHSQVYTWNQSLTLECWDVLPNGEFVEVSAQTLGTEPLDVFSARFKATEWCNAGVIDDR